MSFFVNPNVSGTSHFFQSLAEPFQSTPSLFSTVKDQFISDLNPASFIKNLGSSLLYAVLAPLALSYEAYCATANLFSISTNVYRDYEDSNSVDLQQVMALAGALLALSVVCVGLLHVRAGKLPPKDDDTTDPAISGSRIKDKNGPIPDPEGSSYDGIWNRYSRTTNNPDELDESWGSSNAF